GGLLGGRRFQSNTLNSPDAVVFVLPENSIVAWSPNTLKPCSQPSERGGAEAKGELRPRSEASLSVSTTTGNVAVDTYRGHLSRTVCASPSPVIRYQNIYTPWSKPLDIDSHF